MFIFDFLTSLNSLTLFQIMNMQQTKSDNSLNGSSAACGFPKNFKMGLKCLFQLYLQILKVSSYLGVVLILKVKFLDITKSTRSPHRVD